MKYRTEVEVPDTVGFTDKDVTEIIGDALKHWTDFEMTKIIPGRHPSDQIESQDNVVAFDEFKNRIGILKDGRDALVWVGRYDDTGDDDRIISLSRRQIKKLILALLDTLTP